MSTAKRGTCFKTDTCSNLSRPLSSTWCPPGPAQQRGLAGVLPKEAVSDCDAGCPVPRVGSTGPNWQDNPQSQNSTSHAPSPQGNSGLALRESAAVPAARNGVVLRYNRPADSQHVPDEIRSSCRYVFVAAFSLYQQIR